MAAKVGAGGGAPGGGSTYFVPLKLRQPQAQEAIDVSAPTQPNRPPAVRPMTPSPPPTPPPLAPRAKSLRHACPPPAHPRVSGKANGGAFGRAGR